MRLFRAALILFLSMQLLIPLATQAAPSQQQENKLKLRLWNIPRKGAVDPMGKAKRAVFDLFLKKHPEIEVEEMVPLKIEGAGAEGNEFLAIAGGMAPDVFFLYGRKVGDYIDQSFLAPMNDYFKKDFSDKNKVYNGINAPDKVWELAIRKQKIFAVPSKYYFMSLAYRKDLFIKSGLNPSSPPKNWHEMWEMGKKLTYLPSKEPNPLPGAIPTYGIQLRNGQGHGGWFFLQFVWSAGGQVVESYRKSLETGKPVPVKPAFFPFNQYGINLLNNKDYYNSYKNYSEKNLTGPYIWNLVTNSPGGIKALEYYQKLATQKWIRCYDESGKVISCFDITPEMEKSGTATCPVSGKKFDLNNPEVKNRIYHGIAYIMGQSAHSDRLQIAMQIQTLEEVTNIDWSQFSITAFPVLKGCKTKSFIAGHYYGINATSPANRQEAAWKYIMFMTGEEAQKMRVKAFVENGLAQCIRPGLLKKFGYTDYYRELPTEWIKLYQQISSSAEVEPYCKGFSHVMTVSLGYPIDMALLYPDISCKKLMDETCHEVNTQILSSRPEEEMQRYEKIAYIILTIAIILLSLGFVYIIRAKMRTPSQQASGYIPGLPESKKRLYACSFMAIALFSVALWQYYPLLRGSIMAFQDFKILSGGTFVGPRNFIDIFLEDNFYQYLYQTFFYVAISMLMGFAVPIVLAILLTEIPKGKVLFRVLYYLPAVTTGLVTMFLWKELMFDSSPEGALNWFLSLFGISPQKYLNDPGLAMFCIIIPGIWAGAGPGCLIYLAALKCIPEEQYEAADIDGANIFHKIWHVLIPNIKALLLINFLGAFVGSFQASQNIFVMTGGGPVNRTMTIGLDIWYHSFLYLNFGYATAEAWILGAMLIGFTVIQLRVLNKVEFKRAGR